MSLPGLVQSKTLEIRETSGSEHELLQDLFNTDFPDMVKAICSNVDAKELLDYTQGSEDELFLHKFRLAYNLSEIVEDPKDPISLCHYELDDLISIIELSTKSVHIFSVFVVFCLMYRPSKEHIEQINQKVQLVSKY